MPFHIFAPLPLPYAFRHYFAIDFTLFVFAVFFSATPIAAMP